MKYSYVPCVVVNNNAVRKLLIKLAQENGYSGSSDNIVSSHTHLYIQQDAYCGYGLHGCGGTPWVNGKEELKLVSLEDFILHLTNKVQVEEPISIGDYEVEVSENGVNVGCDFLSKTNVEELVRQANYGNIATQNGSEIYFNYEDEEFEIESDEGSYFVSFDEARSILERINNV